MNRSEGIGFLIGFVAYELVTMTAIPAIAWAAGADPWRAFVFWNLLGLLPFRVLVRVGRRNLEQRS